MATVNTACACPMDSKAMLLAKATNNLSSLFFLMSAGAFRANTVNLGACLCSEAQMLQTLVNNTAAFFTWFANNGGDPIDPAITTWDLLAAVPTTNVAVGAIKLWINAGDAPGAFKIVQLRAGTDATDTANGVQRPNDYDPATNAKVWYQT